MGQKAWGAKTTPHRKRIVKTAEMTVLRRLSESGQLVAENSATNYLTEIWQPKIQRSE